MRILRVVQRVLAAGLAIGAWIFSPGSIQAKEAVFEPAEDDVDARVFGCPLVTMGMTSQVRAFGEGWMHPT